MWRGVEAEEEEEEAERAASVVSLAGPRGIQLCFVAARHAAQAHTCRHTQTRGASEVQRAAGVSDGAQWVAKEQGGIAVWHCVW